MVPERLAERVWWTKSQSSLMNIYSGFQSSLQFIHFRYRLNTVHIAPKYGRRRIFLICDALLGDQTKIELKSLFSCVNRNSIRYRFCAMQSKTYRYSVKNSVWIKTVFVKTVFVKNTASMKTQTFPRQHLFDQHDESQSRQDWLNFN